MMAEDGVDRDDQYNGLYLGSFVGDHEEFNPTQSEGFQMIENLFDQVDNNNQQPHMPIEANGTPASIRGSGGQQGGGGDLLEPLYSSSKRLRKSPKAESRTRVLGQATVGERGMPPSVRNSMELDTKQAAGGAGHFSGKTMREALPSARASGVKYGAMIEVFDGSTERLPGYYSDGKYNVRRRLAQQMKLDERTDISLGKPSVLAGTNLFVCGTDSPDCKHNYILCLDAESIFKKADSPIKCSLPVSEHVRDTHWISPNVVLCATGKDVEIVQVENRGESLRSRGKRSLHHDLIREISPNPAKPLEVASGGYDKKLCVHHLQKGVRLHEETTSDTIGSVKWHKYSREMLGCTMDYGGFLVYDARIGLSKAAFRLNTGKPELYTHCCLDDNSALLGYGDGIIQLVDQRYPKKILQRTQDPYVDGVGDIVFNPSSSSFVVSGLTDFSVWHVDKSKGAASIWSHMHSTKDKPLSGSSYATAACFLDNDSIVMCDRNGYASVYKQQFPSN